ncbi:MAG: DUF1499 domain-containing protein [Alphaproteobacteria bacterium]|nr:DUF1499 domain-containing protein [Alphaproteobacteria bacterium]
MRDLRELVKSGRPNDYLVAPDGYCLKAVPDAAPERLAVPPTRLLRGFRQVALAEPRTELLEYDEGLLSAAFRQRSAFWGFPDLIDLTAIALGDGGSSYALYARAVYGRGDFGVNRERVLRWLAALPGELAKG